MAQNATPQMFDPALNDAVPSLNDSELDSIRDDIFNTIRGIYDPEHPHSLEELGVVRKDLIRLKWNEELNEKELFDDGEPSYISNKSESVTIKNEQMPSSKDVLFTHIDYIPTVPHCSLATIIGLCIKTTLTESLSGICPNISNIKLTLRVKPDSHKDANAITKQLNDKERVIAALENPNLRDMVDNLIQSRSHDYD